MQRNRHRGLFLWLDCQLSCLSNDWHVNTYQEKDEMDELLLPSFIYLVTYSDYYFLSLFLLGNPPRAAPLPVALVRPLNDRCVSCVQVRGNFRLPIET